MIIFTRQTIKEFGYLNVKLFINFLDRERIFYNLQAGEGAITYSIQEGIVGLVSANKISKATEVTPDQTSSIRRTVDQTETKITYGVAKDKNSGVIPSI